MGRKIVIIGGAAGGAGTAARLRRLDEECEIVLIERGEYISFANCGLPYYIGDVISDRNNLLVMTAKAMAVRFALDIRVLHEAIKIDPAAKEVTVRNFTNGEVYTEAYDKLVIAMGSQPVIPDTPGVNGRDIFTIWNMRDTDAIKEFVQKRDPKSVAIIGAGYIGVEMAENFAHLGLDVTMLVRSDQIMRNFDLENAVFIQEELTKHGVKLRFGVNAERFEDDPDGGKIITLDSGDKVKCDIVMLCAGVLPNGELAIDAGLEVNGRGGIIVDEHLKTSDDDIYALGDVIQVQDAISGRNTMIPLAGPANKQARICADNLCGIPSTYDGTMGAAVAKIFDLTAACLGSPAHKLEAGGDKEGVDFFRVRTHAFSHASYYPGATKIAMTLYYDRDGKILGAQAVGYEGVEKRMDVIATVIKTGGTVRDLKDLELCYAPPYSSAKDPVNMLGFMADNHLAGRIEFVGPRQLPELAARDDVILLDVRENSEVEAGPVKGAVNIPLPQLRSRLGELDKNKKIVVFCLIGLRAYIASRILINNGFEDVVDYGGGYSTYAPLERIGKYNSRKRYRVSQ